LTDVNWKHGNFFYVGAVNLQSMGLSHQNYNWFALLLENSFTQAIDSDLYDT